MKRILITSILIITQFITVKAQTEAETIDFLNTMLTSYAASMSENPARIDIQTHQNKDSEKLFSITLVMGDWISSSFFYPKDINNVIPFRAPNGNLCLKMISLNNQIFHKYSNSDDITFEGEIRIVLRTDDKEVERIKKALIHLLKLNNAPIIDNKLFAE